tara:strand:+ start:2304 stop:2651 length:348 start_codon:yes stop_codon:yes gene_type:complete
MPYKNKDDQKAAGRRHYLANKARCVERAKLHKIGATAKARAWVLSYKETHPCVDCGEADPVVLTFDHIKGAKRGNLGDIGNLGWGLASVKAEVDKCVVRCANCHLRQTKQRREEK